MEEEELLVAEKTTIWPWEERLAIMLVLGLVNARGQIQIGFYNCCKFIRSTVLLH